MSERIIEPPQKPAELPASPEDMAHALIEIEAFLHGDAPRVGRLYGVELAFRVGQLQEGAGMATDTETGDVIVDPRFWWQLGYNSSEYTSYGIMHETAAHVLRIMKEPVLSERIDRFANLNKANHIFINIFEDVAGNNLTHTMLPNQSEIAARLYKEKLFSETDYQAEPRHLQFLYKIIRQEMIPGSETAVLPEVDEAITSLRNYQGKGDLIKYSTAIAKTAYERMKAQESFDIWRKAIYPVYAALLEQDRQDPERQDQGQTEQGDGQQGDQPEAKQNQDGSEQSQQSPTPSNSAQSNKQTDDERFGSFYENYHADRHPDPMSHEEEDKLIQRTRERAQNHQWDPAKHNRQLDEQLQQETGHTLATSRRYKAELEKWQPVIEEMRAVFMRVVNERTAQKRGLSRQTFAEGAVLDDPRMPQTYADVLNNIAEPEAFTDYIKKRGETQIVGKTDYVFLFDVSGSMTEGTKSQDAAAAAVVSLEALDGMQRDLEKQHQDLDLDIRTAIFTFGSTATQVKPLSSKVTEKQKFDTYAAIANPSSSSTQDFLALEEVESWDADKDRRKILIAVSDGGSDIPTRARRSIDNLRGKGWFVYGISIGSDEAENLYQPTARRVDDARRLPEIMQGFIEATIS